MAGRTPSRRPAGASSGAAPGPVSSSRDGAGRPLCLAQTHSPAASRAVAATPTEGANRASGAGSLVNISLTAANAGFGCRSAVTIP